MEIDSEEMEIEIEEMEIEISNVIHHVCYTGGRPVSVTVFWAAQNGFKARPGLVFKVPDDWLIA